ncbi:MAG: flagellin lysine-N-methylase, partial [Victivallales bacterium]|nr:flagellin lysine-N-methylase [Victivallales bacterium]
MPEFLVPDYFTDFKCKIGACRHQCCFGWPISISMKEYFRLLGEECNDELRHRLDVSLHVCDNPTEERYAQVCPRYDGRCAMMYPDGRCAIHADLGEAALPEPCRLYPRGVRDNGECSCANSCEAVIELLIHHCNILKFNKMQLDIEVVPSYGQHDDEASHIELRMALVGIMQDRTKKMLCRLRDIGMVLMSKDAGIEDAELIDAVLELEDSMDVSGWLKFAEAIVAELVENSYALREYGEKALCFFRKGDEQYAIAASVFETHFPDWENRFENILVNQMFFSQFPFGPNSNITCEFIGLFMTYVLMRFLCLGNLADNPTDEHFVDVCAALFRLVSHTDFGRTA